MNRLTNEIQAIINTLVIDSTDRAIASRGRNELFYSIQNKLKILARDASYANELKNQIIEYLDNELDFDARGISASVSDTEKNRIVNSIKERVTNTPDSEFEIGISNYRRNLNRSVARYLENNEDVFQKIIQNVKKEINQFLEAENVELTSGEKGAITRDIRRRIITKTRSVRFRDIADIESTVANLVSDLPDYLFNRLDDYAYWRSDTPLPEIRDRLRSRFTEETFSPLTEGGTQYFAELNAQSVTPSDAEIKANYIDNVTDDTLKKVRQKTLGYFNSIDASPNIVIGETSVANITSDKTNVDVKVLLDNIRIEESPLYGEKIVFHYNKNIAGGGRNGAIDSLIRGMKQAVKDEGLVFQIEIAHDVESYQHGNTARHANEIVDSTGAVRNIEANNTTGKISLTQIYYPEKNDLVLNKFVEWYDQKMEALTTSIEQQGRLLEATGHEPGKVTNIITEDGPKFVNRPGHISQFNNGILSLIRQYPELQFILDTAHSADDIQKNSIFKWEVIASNKEYGQLYTVNEIHTEGYEKWFNDILRLNNDTVDKLLEKHPKWKKIDKWIKGHFVGQTIVNNKFQIIDESPGWVYGLVHTGPDGKKRIISLALSDSGVENNYGNSVDYDVDQKTSSINTNFISWQPVNEYGEPIVYGYYPNLVESIESIDPDGKVRKQSINRLLKKKAVRTAEMWFGGMLAVAEVDNVICDCSAINSQVGNIYQRGGFISTALNNLTVGDVEVPHDTVSTSLVRIPGNYAIVSSDPNNPSWGDIENGSWHIFPLQGELEFNLTMDTRIWSKPENLDGTVKRTYFLPSQIDQSPRHKAISALINFDMSTYSHLDKYDRLKAIGHINQQLMLLGGLQTTNSYHRDNILSSMGYGTNNNTVNNLKYVFNNQTTASNHPKLSSITEYLDPKKLGQLIFNSTLLENITGLDVTQLNDEERKRVNVTHDTKQKIDTGSIKEASSSYREVEANGDVVREVVIDSMPEELRKEVGIFTKEEVLESVNEGLDDANKVTELSEDFWRNWAKGTLSNTDFSYGENTLGLFDDTIGSTTGTLPDSTSPSIFNLEVFRSEYESSPGDTRSRVLNAISSGQESPQRVVNRGLLVDEMQWTQVQETVTGRNSYLTSSGLVSNRQRELQKRNLFEILYPDYTGPVGQEGGRFIERLHPRASHRFTHLLNELTKKDGGILLTSDIEYVGHNVVNNKAIDYFEIGTIKQVTKNGEIKLVKNYMTIAVDFNNISEVTDGVSAKILSVQQVHHEPDVIMGQTDIVTNRTFQAFNMLLNDLDIPTVGYRRPTKNTVITQIHPVGRVGRNMGVMERTIDDSPLITYKETYTETNLNRTVATINGYDSDPLMKNAIKELTEESTNQKQDKGAGQIVPQPLYSTINLLTDLDSADAYNTLINDLFEVVDMKTTGAVALEFKVSSPGGTYTLGTLIKRHGQDAKFVRMVDVNQRIPEMDTDKIVWNSKKNVIEVLGDLEDPQGAGAIFNNQVRFTLSNVELTAPNKDFGNRVVQNSLSKISMNLKNNHNVSEPFSLQVSGSSLTNVADVVDKQLDQPTNFQNRITNLSDGEVPLQADENLPRIQSEYSLGQSIGRDGGTEFLGQNFDPNRPPVGLNPDKKTLRKLAKEFARTKTGKTLGYAWKTVDIGETLISQAFKKAAQGAAAAGAIGLGTGVAALATLWATWEIGNLIVAGMKGVPDLYNVYEKRNEVLANGEYWEKQLVEETFWKDYGGEILEILQDAAETSPAEMLGDKIWSFALDNLFRQSQGESFPEIYEEDDTELNMANDIYYSKLPDEVKLQQMQNSIDYDRVLTGYYNSRPEANVIMNRTYELANNVYNNRDG